MNELVHTMESVRHGLMKRLEDVDVVVDEPATPGGICKDWNAEKRRFQQNSPILLKRWRCQLL